MSNKFKKEACYVYSIPKSQKKDILKVAAKPGPGSYDPNINVKLKSVPKIR
jgi:hypothetical protein